MQKTQPETTEDEPNVVLVGGVAMLRTEPMELEEANAVCRALHEDKNIVEAVVNPTSRGSNKYYVAFLPSNPKLQETIADSFNDKRLQTMLAEIFEWDWKLKDEATDLYEVTTCPDKKTGNRDTYECNDQGCTCPDYMYRLRASGFDCKHMLGWKMKGFRIRWGVIEIGKGKSDTGVRYDAITVYRTYNEALADMQAEIEAASVLPEDEMPILEVCVVDKLGREVAAMTTTKKAA